MTVENPYLIGNSLVDLWIGVSNGEVNDTRKKEMESLRTTLSKGDLNKLFPRPRGQDSHYPHYAPLITTPHMLEEFLDQWDSTWRENRSFSLKSAFQELHQILRDVEGGRYVVYAQMRGLYRVRMLQNILQTGWRPGRNNPNTRIEQDAKDKELKGLVLRQASYRHSDTWAYFATEGYEKWKTGQGEVLSYLETFAEGADHWRKIFVNTQRDLGPK